MKDTKSSEDNIRTQYHEFYDLLNSGLCLIKTDANETILFANQKVAELYECESEEELLTYCDASYQHMMDADSYRSLNELAKAHPEHFHFMFHYRTKQGHFRQVKGIGALKQTAYGMVYVIQIFSMEQIAEDQEADGNTGLPGMHKFFDAALQRAREYNENHTLAALCPVSFDVTRFKEYNRMHGTRLGDQCLKKIANTIKAYFPGALIGHLAADHFVALLPEHQLESKLEDVCNEVNHYINDGGIRLKAGIYRTREEDSLDNLRHLFDAAKIACDSIKSDGNRSVAVFTKVMEESNRRKTYILRNFNEALEKSYIKVYYQPILRTLTGNLWGFEALARWEDPELGMIAPDIFVPILEEAQLINLLDRYVMERVMQICHDRIQNLLPLFPVSINLSGFDFEISDPLSTIEKLVDRYQVPRSLLNFEVTERVMSKNRLSMMSKIYAMQKAGFQVWMDDFGSEYSSLRSLHNFHFDVIKIDMGFFRDFDERSRKIISAIVMMGKELGIQTLAEGVENQEQVAFLTKIGCGRMQGYIYGQPMMYEDIPTCFQKSRIQPEDPESAHLLDATESVNLMSDLPTAIFRFDGKNISLLIENDAYIRELRSTGTQNLKEANANLIAKDYPFRGIFIQLLKKTQRSHHAETTFYVDNGQYMKVTVNWIAGSERLFVGEAHLYNMSTKADLQEAGNMDAALRNIFHMYEGFYLLDRSKNEVRVLQSNHHEVASEHVDPSIMTYFISFADHLVYPEDRERFINFIRPEKLEEKVLQDSGNTQIELVRIRKNDGSYRWTVFEAMIIYKSLHKNILLCEREDIWEQKRDRETLLPDFCRSFGITACSCAPGISEESYLFHTLKEYGPYAFIWKDRSGRILGASRKFIMEGGFTNGTEILGKTETELGWYVDPSVPSEVERQLLEQGKDTFTTTEPVLNVGKIEELFVTWAPWYHEKGIAGIMGMVSAKNTTAQDDLRLGLSDPETGLLSFRGAIETGLVYADQYRAKKIDYTGVLIDITSYAGVLRDNPETADHLLKEIIASLCEALIPGWTIARIGLCCFLCFKHRNNTDDIADKLEQVSETLPLLWRNMGLRTMPRCTYAITYGSEVNSFDELLQLLIRRLSSAEKHVYGERPYIGDRVVIRRDALDSAPDRIVISDPKTYELVYLNQNARKDVGLKPEEGIKGKLCYEVLEGFHAPCADCPNLQLRNDHIFAASHLCHKSNDRMLIRSLLIPWENRVLRFTHATNMTEYASTLAKDHELIYQELRANEAISLGLREDDPNRGIEKFMDCIARNLRPERFLIFEEREDNTVSASYEWTASGVLPLKEELQSIPKSNFRALYHAFNLHHVVIISDMASFQSEHPDFSLRMHGVRSFASGQLMLANRCEGFTMVINPSEDTVQAANLLLSTLTDFLAILIRNRNALQLLEGQSMKDQLTNIGNRRGLEKRIRAWQGDGVIGVISVDLNGLKDINDTKGHHAGDILISETARILGECAGLKNVFRTGGDEFLVVTEDLDAKDIELLIRHMRESAENNGISMAIGYACTVGKVTDFDALLTKADLSMYKDKGHSYRRRREDRK